MVTLHNITFNLFAQTSQLAARINLGSPQVWDTETRGIGRKRGTVDSGKSGDEKGRKEQIERETKRAKSRRETIGRSRGWREVIGRESEQKSMRWQPMRRERRNRFTKPGAPPTVDVGSFFILILLLVAVLLLVVVSVAAVAGLDGGMIGWTGCPLLFSFLHSHLCRHADLRVPL